MHVLKIVLKKEKKIIKTPNRRWLRGREGRRERDNSYCSLSFLLQIYILRLMQFDEFGKRIGQSQVKQFGVGFGFNDFVVF
jgi:hypothetical protein